MSTTTTTGKNKSEELDRMGVASISSNKRRLENPDDGDEDYVIAAKVAKKATAVYVESAAEVQDTIGHENSSDFLTTSILARTLLTSTATGVTSQLSYSPLESLSSTLEALPAPSLLLDTGVSESEIRSTFLPFKTTIQEATELEFTSLLCHERTLSTVTVLSPIDEDSSDWSSVVSGSGGSSNGSSSVSAEVRQGTKISNGCTMSNVMSDQQVITEDETGKSYFNLGSADTTLLVKKSPPALPPTTTGNNISNGGGPHQSPNHQSLNHNNNNHHHHHHQHHQQQQQQHGSPIGVVVTTNSGPSVTDQSWMNGCNNSTDFIDDGSSSSCESISSEDLFTSEEFDASEDEEEIRTYKQQRSTVLHISLCKLNSFRTQQCVEPSLHRSVLICNTLRHIEQEIRSEDEIPMRNVGRGGGGGNNQPLPPFWASSPNNPNSNGNNNPNPNPNPSPGNNNNNSNSMVGNVSPVVLNQASQQQMTDIRPNQNQAQSPIQNQNQNQNQPHVASLHGGHDPYLSPLPNSYSPNNTAESPYSSYDYNSLRPNPTPFHTASYDYTEQDLSLVSGSPGTAQILDVSSPPSLLECDSGYAEDLNLSSYYYNTNPSPGPPPQQIPAGPPRPGTPRNGLAVIVNVNSHSIQIPIQQQVPGSNENNGANNVGVGVGVGVGNPNVNTNDSSYLNCGYNNLNLVGDSSVVGVGVGVGVGMSPTCSNNGTDSLLSDTSSLLSSTSDMSDIEMLSPVSEVTAPSPGSVSNNSGDGLPPSSPVAMPISVVDSRASTNCDYNNLLVNNSNSNNVIGDSSTIESSSSSDNSLSPPPQQMNDLSLNLNCVSTAIAPPLTPNPNPNSGLCWSKIPNSNPLSCPNNSSGSNNSKEMIPLNNSTNSQQHNNNNNNNCTTAFIQQESHQCGMESRLSEFSRSHSNFTNPHHHNLPMDSLISANYSNSL